MKKIVFLLFSIIIFVFALVRLNPPQTELMQAFIDPSSKSEIFLAKLANISSDKINIVFEAEDQEALEDLQVPFLKYKTNFDQKVMDVYRNYPANFLSQNKIKLLQDKNYKELDAEALNGIYSPLGIYIAPIESDPYLFATDFVMNLGALENDYKEINGKYYALMRVEANNVAEILDLANSAEGGKVYLSGTPVHSYTTSKKSALEINLICLISTLFVALLAKRYFKSFRIIVPIALSILFGFMLGFSVTQILFSKIHVLTFVFSTTLIGISLDYSLHYFLTARENGFKKSLTCSMLTTVLAFSILYFSNIEILKQISLFTSFGLVGVYLFVLIVLPEFKFQIEPTPFQKINLQKIKPYFFAFVALVILFGAFKIKFDDNVKNLYVPPKNLMQAEKIYREIFAPKEVRFSITSGKNLDEILEKQEANPEDFGLSNFVSSRKKQLANRALVKNLYKADLDRFANFLDAKSISDLKNEIRQEKFYDVEQFPLKSQFMLDKNTAFSLTYGENGVSISESITEILQRIRHKCFILIPFAFTTLFLFLSFLFGAKNSLKITASPLIGAGFAICFLSVLGIKINLFHILALFLIIGFSLDYSIFRLGSGEKSKDAVFMSFLSTAISFLLLSFTSFKLISSLGATLFLGITISYVASLFMIKSKDE